MRVVHVSALLDPERRTPAALLEAWPTLPDVATAVARAGASVMCVVAAHESARIERSGVMFEFVAGASAGPRGMPRALAAAVARQRADVVHFNGFAFPGELAAVRAALPATPVLVQDHADRPPRLRRAEWRRALAGVDGVAFTAQEQARPFFDARLLDPRTVVYAVPESSARFAPGDVAAARARLGLDGAPCIAWVGRLDANKDPVTVLRGFRRALDTLPGARLCICHGDAPLLPAVRALLDADPLLRSRVHLLGTLAHRDVELLLQAADIFVAASRRESCGYALIEALACGCTPVVSDIPPFRALLGDAAGALFPCGDDVNLAAALVEHGLRIGADTRAVVREHFERHLSFAAVGARLSAVYADLIERRTHAEQESAGRDPDAADPPAAGDRPGRPGTTGRAVRPALRVALLVPGGVDRSGVRRVIPRVLWLIEQLALRVDLHVIALRQEERACTYPLLGATVHCLPAGASRIQALRMLRTLQRDLDFDVWHALWLHPQGTLAGAVGALSRRPVLLHLTGGDFTALPEIGYGALATWRGRFWLRAATRAASAVTVSSLALREAAARLGVNAEVVSFGIDFTHWPPGLPRRRVPGSNARLLHVGTINRVKDHDTLLRALDRLRTSGIDFSADLVGEDLLAGAAHRQAERLGLADVVRFHGWQPHEATRAFFAEADLLLVSSRHESGPFVLHEAAAAGVPTVGTAVGDLLEWAPDAAVTVPVGDAAALADAAALLLSDEARRLATAERAHARSLRVDAAASATRVVEIYEALTSRARPLSRGSAHIPV